MASESSNSPYVYEFSNYCLGHQKCPEKHFCDGIGYLHIKEGIRYIFIVGSFARSYSVGSDNTLQWSPKFPLMKKNDVDKTIEKFIETWKQSSPLPKDLFDLIMGYIVKHDWYGESHVYLLKEEDLKQRKEQ